MTLTEFIKARLDEDEAAAKAAVHQAFRHWRTEPWYDGRFLKDGRTKHADVWGDTGYGVTGRGAVDTVTADHIARHDPARVLREAEAKRVILAGHGEVTWRQDGITVHSEVCGCSKDWPCPTVRAVLAVWNDHPDYDKGWA